GREPSAASLGWCTGLHGRPCRSVCPLGPPQDRGARLPAGAMVSLCALRDSASAEGSRTRTTRRWPMEMGSRRRGGVAAALVLVAGLLPLGLEALSSAPARAVQATCPDPSFTMTFTIDKGQLARAGGATNPAGPGTNTASVTINHNGSPDPGETGNVLFLVSDNSATASATSQTGFNAYSSTITAGHGVDTTNTVTAHFTPTGSQ